MYWLAMRSVCTFKTDCDKLIGKVDELQNADFYLDETDIENMYGGNVLDECYKVVLFLLSCLGRHMYYLIKSLVKHLK